MKPRHWELTRRAEDINEAFQHQIIKYLDGFEETILEIKTYLKRRKYIGEGNAFAAHNSKGWIEEISKNKDGLMIENGSGDCSRFLYTFNKNKNGTVIQCHRVYVDWHDSLQRHDYRHFIHFAKSIYSDYTDCYEENQVITRPNLSYIKDNIERIENEDCAQSKPLFTITKLKKSVLDSIPGYKKLVEFNKEMNQPLPIDRDGFLITYEAKNVQFRMGEIYSVCNATEDILELIENKK